MAIEIEDYWLIKKLCNDHHLSGNVLILGDCYYHFNHKDIGIEKKSDIQTDVFINTLGFNSVETVDVVGSPSFKFDLQAELPENFKNKYDIIIDSGTLCCCFDVSLVLKNLHLLLKDNGHVFHFSYFVGFFGRGYYSFQPNFFQDYFKVNGYNLTYLGLRKKTKYSGFIRKIFRYRFLWRQMKDNASYFDGDTLSEKHYKDPSMISNNMVIGAFAQKNNSSNEIIMPTPLLVNEV